MPSFGTTSEKRLQTCHPDLQLILRSLIRHYDFSVVCGHRGEAEQNAAFDSGASQVRWPDSKHNSSPSMAVDIVPYDRGQLWESIPDIAVMAGRVMEIARYHGITLRWGGDWNQDGYNHDNGFNDLYHFELIGA